MKYTNEIIIKLPRAKVIELFDNPENLKKWQPGLQSIEHISGESGKSGAKFKLKFKMGRRKMEMIETVIRRDFPNEYSSSYEVKGTLNTYKNFFEAIDENTTRYHSESEFKFSGIGMKIAAFIMPGAFRKQTQKYMLYFKDFAEMNDER